VKVKELELDFSAFDILW